MRSNRFILVISLFLCGWLATPAFAGDIKARMRDRLPEISALKARGVVGENNKGFLEFRSGKKEGGDTVAAENADRRTVYAAIARQQGTSPALVGKRRAMQIRQIAKPGEWLQDDSGKWYKK